MVIVAGSVVLRPGSQDALRPAMEDMISASRAEEGCITYSYGFDVLDDTILRVFEQWKSEAHLKAHFQTAHIKVWRTALAEAGIVSRNLKMYEVGNTKNV